MATENCLPTHRFDTRTKAGWVEVKEEDGAIVALHFILTPVETQGSPAPTPLLAEAEQQLRAYFAGERRTFSLPFFASGTSFQTAVWDALKSIPYGETRTYGQIAATVGKPRASRAVGAACHVNPIGIIVPCHRVVGASGALTGYAGGLTAKKYLLDMEKEAVTR